MLAANTIGRVVVATYNTRNLFSAGQSEQAKKPRALRELARMVGKVDADVLALQEVGDIAALAQLNARLPQPYPHCVLAEGNSTRGIHLAFMSRFPLELRSHRATPLQDESGKRLYEYPTEQAAAAGLARAARFARDLALAQVAFGDQTIAVFNTHLKSRIQNAWSGNDSAVIRRAEAQAVADIVSAYAVQHATHAVVVLGDFNERLDHDSLQPIQALALFDPVLVELVSGDAQLSTHWSKPRDRIDHLLLGEAARTRYVAGSAAVHREAGARKASDHYPVSAALQF